MWQDPDKDRRKGWGEESPSNPSALSCSVRLHTGILVPSLDRPQEASDARYGNKHRDSLENAHDGETLDSSETDIWENPVTITG